MTSVKLQSNSFRHLIVHGLSPGHLDYMPKNKWTAKNLCEAAKHFFQTAGVIGSNIGRINKDAEKVDKDPGRI